MEILSDYFILRFRQSRSANSDDSCNKPETRAAYQLFSNLWKE